MFLNSTIVLINGELSAPFALGQGVRQGDPVSPAPFILAMDTLHAMLLWAVQQSLLSPLGLDSNTPRASIFADDVVLFFRPTPVDNQVIAGMLDLFGEASGLRINLRKSTITCIRCDDEVENIVAEHFQRQRQKFLIRLQHIYNF